MAEDRVKVLETNLRGEDLVTKETLKHDLASEKQKLHSALEQLNAATTEVEELKEELQDVQAISPDNAVAEWQTKYYDQRDLADKFFDDIQRLHDERDEARTKVEAIINQSAINHNSVAEVAKYRKAYKEHKAALDAL
jgi:DNA repair ATPase RecN